MPSAAIDKSCVPIANCIQDGRFRCRVWTLACTVKMTCTASLKLFFVFTELINDDVEQDPLSAAAAAPAANEASSGDSQHTPSFS